MSVLVELSHKDKPIGQIKVSDSGFVFMTDYSRKDLGQQNYSYFDRGSCPLWDKAVCSKDGEK